jgi:hypothetical protein
MKTRKLLEMFMFLSVLGFLFEGCASLDFEKEFSQITDAQISTFLKNESNRSQFPTKPAKLWMLESPTYWQRQYDFMQKNSFYNSPYNRPLGDSLQERHLREQAEMFQKIKDGTYLPKPFSPHSFENHFKDLKIESIPRNLPTAPVPPKFDFPANQIIIRK